MQLCCQTAHKALHLDVATRWPLYVIIREMDYDFVSK